MTTAVAVLTRVHRIEVRPRPDAGDPRARSLQHDAAAIGITLSSARTTRVYLIEAALDSDQLQAIRTRLLVDPVIESGTGGASPTLPGEITVEVHPLPGVMDPAAQTVARAIAELTGAPAAVVTAWRYDLGGVDRAAAMTLARRLLANPVVHALYDHAHLPEQLPKGRPAEFRVTHVEIRRLDDDALERLSRDAHLFLSLDEMRAIRDEYRRLNREPTDIELETLAQTWSEHCVHKTLKSTIRYRQEGTQAQGHGGGRDAERARSASQADPIRWEGRPGHQVHADGSVTIHNLLKSTVAAATHELIAEGVDWTLSVFVDNAGVITFDDNHAVCVKVETHNHPSALEPYGGAATGIGGCIRDIMGTGLAAKPIASTDVFCVAHPRHWYAEDAKSAKGADSEESSSKQVPASFSAAPAPSATCAYQLPAGCLHPRRILTDVVAGVRDYGNRMGIPTVNGAVWFDDRYVGNPLVFCGCVGIMPRDRIDGKARPGDLIVALGGRTGRDGIHGATFSSAELTDTHADEFAHAVQIGNAIEEKRVLDAILRARDYVACGHEGQGGEATQARPEGGAQEPSDETRARSACEGNPFPTSHAPFPLFNAITDCGAGGFSSAVGEMGEHLGAEVHLDRAPLKYAGLTYTEIWISEAQERMVLAVPKENLPALQQICDEEHVELSVLGTFGTPARDLVLHYNGHEVGRLPMHFLHNGIPTPTREAVWKTTDFTTESHGVARSKSENDSRPDPLVADGRSLVPFSVSSVVESPSPRDALLALLAHPNIASKHFIIRQYDHEVQGNTVIRPLGGPCGRGPMDAAVIEPVPGTHKGLAIACGLGVDRPAEPILDGSGHTNHPLGAPIYTDPYEMALAAIDECVRNLVCVGADPNRIAILDNFCWPSCKKPENLASLVRAAEGCYDGAKAYRTPFISGKDSLNNQFTIPGENGRPARTIEIPPTLLITGVGIVHDVRTCVTMDAKKPGNTLIAVEPMRGTFEQWAEDTLRLGGTHLAQIGALPPRASTGRPRPDPEASARLARAVHQAMNEGLVESAHDASDGGILCAVAEMLIAGSTPERPLGCRMYPLYRDDYLMAYWFGERSCYVLECKNPVHTMKRIGELYGGALGANILGSPLDASGILDLNDEYGSVPVSDLAAAWLGTLDW